MTEIKNWIRKNSQILTVLGIYFLGIILFGLLLIFTDRIAGSDDYIFQKQIAPFPTLLDWITYRYDTWSGRIFAESFVYIFSPLHITFWKIASFILFALFSGFTYLYYLLFTTKRSKAKDYVMMALALILPLLIDTHVLTEGMLWVTGSMNYFWLATFAIVGLYPFAYYLTKTRLPHWTVLILSSLCSIVAASSHEQIGSILICLSIIGIGYMIFFTQNKPTRVVYAYLALQTLLIVAAFIISIKAPGNHYRAEVETAYRLPDFYTVPLLEHINYAYRWFIDSIINRLGLILPLTWVLILGLFYHKSRSTKLDKYDYAISGVLGVATLFLLLKGFNTVDYWLNFYATWKQSAPRTSLLALIVWTVALIATICAPLVLFKRKPVGIVITLLIIASLASAALMVLSPSMYASGFRVLYVSGIVLGFVCYLLFDKLFDSHKKVGFIIFTSITLLALSHYISILGLAIRS